MLGKFGDHPIPIMVVGDNPCLFGGLSRIGRDLATLLCTMPEFRVGYLGQGIGQDVRLPFILYDYPPGGWGEEYIQRAWENFSRGEYGIILTTDDPSRRHWFANPVGMSPELQRFLGPGRNFQKWGYFPIDSTGPDGQSLSAALRDCVSRYDRVLGASEFAKSVMITGGRTDVDWLPHGIFGDKFNLGMNSYEPSPTIRVGCVMANQVRKDYGVLFNVFHLLKKEYGNQFQGYVKCDVISRHWNLQALAVDYGVDDCVTLMVDPASDEDLAAWYRLMDCTVLPSGGEGFGYPIVESMACGTPCVVTDYAAGPAFVSSSYWARPETYRLETPYNTLRAVNSAQDFTARVYSGIDDKRSGYTAALHGRVDHLDWEQLKHSWMRWFRDGIRNKSE